MLTLSILVHPFAECLVDEAAIGVEPTDAKGSGFFQRVNYDFVLFGQDWLKQYLALEYITDCLGGLLDHLHLAVPRDG